MNVGSKKQFGFTIVELLIVIVVIAILASITIVAYNGIQNRSRNSQVQNDIRNVAQLIELYNAQEGTYPSTGGLSRVYYDANCLLTTDSDGYKGADWVPGLAAITNSLPQSNGLVNVGRGGYGCYTYASDGINYVVSAWNARRGGPATDSMYRRLGWRENSNFVSNTYLCNHNNIGGNSTGTYDIRNDYYKYSFTISNITSCVETPPSGA